MKGLMNRKRRWMSAAAGMVMSILVVASVGAQGAEIVQSITGGGQPTITINTVSLAPASYSAEEQSSPGQLGYTIDAEIGTSDGWMVTLQAGDLVYSGDHGGTNISAQNLAVAAANAPVYISGDAVDATAGPGVPVDGATGSLDSPRTVLVASRGAGHGVYQQNLDLLFTIPAGSKPGNYAGTITFTTVAAP